MKRASRLLLALLFLSGVLLALPAAPVGALSCLHPLDRVDRMEILLKGEIIGVPRSHWAEVAVERYYRGIGPAKLYVEFRGTGGDPTYHWAHTPVAGTTLLLEVRTDSNGYFNGPCDLYTPFEAESPDLQQVLTLLGEGSQPDPNAPVPMHPWIRTALWLALPAVGAATWLLRRRQRVVK